MATISFTIPNAQLTRVIDAICGQWSYQATILNADGKLIPNPEDKSTFAKRMIAKYMKSLVESYEVNLATQTARTQAISDVESGVSIT